MTFSCQISGKDPCPLWIISKHTEEYRCFGGKQKPGISMALTEHLLGINMVIKPHYAPTIQGPGGLWLQMTGA